MHACCQDASVDAAGNDRRRGGFDESRDASDVFDVSSGEAAPGFADDDDAVSCGSGTRDRGAQAQVARPPQHGHQQAAWVRCEAVEATRVDDHDLGASRRARTQCELLGDRDAALWVRGCGYPDECSHRVEVMCDQLDACAAAAGEQCEYGRGGAGALSTADAGEGNGHGHECAPWVGQARPVGRCRRAVQTGGKG